MSQKFYYCLTYTLAFILLILGLYYYGKAYGLDNEIINQCEDDCFNYDPQIILENITFIQLNALNYDDCKTYQQKFQFHKENAERCFEDAKKKCWWLPNIDDRDKARYCLTNIGVIISPGDPKSKLIIAVITTLVQYGLDCNDEWNYIQNKLKWAQYHYEMMEFFEEVVKQTTESGKNNNQVNNNQGVKYVVPMKNAVVPIPYNHHKKKK